MGTMVDHAPHNEDTKNTKMNVHEAVGLYCCEVCEENLVKELSSKEEACDRQDLLAEQQRRNAVSRNSAQSLVCTDV